MKESVVVEPVLSEAQTSEQCWSIGRDVLLDGLKTVAGVVESSQVLQILSHVQLTAMQQTLRLVASDSEVELLTTVQLSEPVSKACSVSVSCRKLIDVCRTLPQDALLFFYVAEGWLTVKSGKTQFKLATLPADRFPLLHIGEAQASVMLPEQLLRQAIQKTHFSMAHQDVRFFLNGLHIQIRPGQIITTATDGHRLARFVTKAVETDAASVDLIMPRKAVLELLRLLMEIQTDVQISISKEHVQISAEDFTLTSNLLEGQYPACDRLLAMPDNYYVAGVCCHDFKQVLSRAAILSHEKFKGARLVFQPQLLEVNANNADQECSEDGFPVEYDGPHLKLAFNVNYLLDVLSAVNSETLNIHLTGSQSSVLITESADTDQCCRYLIMPLTL